MFFQNTKRKNIKYKPGSKIACNNCSFLTDDSLNFSTHRKTKHQKPIVKTSTRDNSVLNIMNENMDLSAISMSNETIEKVPEITLEESAPKEEIIILQKKQDIMCSIFV